MEIHRCRFVKWTPSAIQAIAFSQDGSAVAVGRRNGDIEIWRTHFQWYLERRLVGGAPDSFRSVVWVPRTTQSTQAMQMDATERAEMAATYSERLFSAGLDGRIVEWDLQKLCPKISSDSYGGAVWCMALDHSKTRLAVGCEDGGIRLFDVSPDSLALSYSGIPALLKTFSRQSGLHARILSLTWSLDDSEIFSGGSDGTIRSWDVATGMPKLRITVQKRQKGRNAMVWSVIALPHRVVASGDSAGRTCFWDARTGTLLHSFHQHAADVLAVATCPPTADVVYSAGVDAKIAIFRRTGQKWVYVDSQRSHSHDITVLAAAKLSTSTRVPTLAAGPVAASTVLVSGGEDTVLCVYGLANQCTGEISLPLRLHTAPPIDAFAVTTAPTAAARPLMLVRHTQHLELWMLGEAQQTSQPLAELSEGTTLPLNDRPSLLVNLKTKSRVLMCSALSRNGRYLSYSDGTATRIVRIQYAESPRAAPELQRIHSALFDTLSARRLLFSEDGAFLLAADADAAVHVIDLSTANDGGQPRLLRTFTNHNGLPVVALAVSSNGQWMASADVAHRVFLYRRTGDAVEYQDALPVFEQPIVGLKFTHAHTAPLLVALGHANAAYFYDVDSRKLKDFSVTREKFSKRLSKRLGAKLERMRGLAVDPGRPQKVLLYSRGNLCSFDSSVKQPTVAPTEAGIKAATEAAGNHEDGESMEIDRPESSGQANVPKGPYRFTFYDRYESILFFDYIDARRAVVVERPWEEVVSELPPPLYRKRFGT